MRIHYAGGENVAHVTIDVGTFASLQLWQSRDYHTGILGRPLSRIQVHRSLGAKEMRLLSDALAEAERMMSDGLVREPAHVAAA